MSLQFISDNHGNKVSVVIPIQDWNKLKKQYKVLEKLETDDNETTKESIISDLKEAVDQLSLARQGKLKLKSARDLYNEL